MPEKPSVPAIDRCNKCTTSDGLVQGPSPTTHAEICCLYRLTHPGQSEAFLNEENHKRRDCGRCKDCPTRLKLHQKPQVGPTDQAPEKSSSDPPQQGTGSQLKRRKRIEPRLRSGFKKLTLEIRPHKFKKKLWFGTYTAEEIDRAKDAVNYYMGCNQPYNHPDSPLIFGSKSLKGIKFEDLQPSCDDYVEVGEGLELKYKYFARQVKDVIHSVTGKHQKSKSSNPKSGLKRNPKRNPKCKEPQEMPPRLGIWDPTMPDSSTTSLGTQDHEVTDSPILAIYPSEENLTYDEDILIPELLRSSYGREAMFSLEEMFAPASVVCPLGYGDSSTTEEEDFPSELWSFGTQNYYEEG